MNTLIPAQITGQHSTEALESVEDAKEATQALAAVTLGTNIVLSGAMSQVWGMINGLQLFVNLPLFDVQFPSFTLKIVEGLITIATFDVMPSDDIMTVTLDLSED